MTDINQQYQKIQGLESELSQLKTSSSRSEKQIKTLETNIVKADEGVCPHVDKILHI